ncbi:hypothetical protein NQ317_006798 [Molorchus minor]|uniref:Thyroglobulin type-1 domain-containing protein n=1 Tax=Molorchus minor TaxID=1323400 RepID=A0ABQ9IX55_9CUCU|nr:hypothetical protein NQ317_006798 [Molorchus minor]
MAQFGPSMELRQDCDDEGLFASYRCIPGQSCHCLSKTAPEYLERPTSLRFPKCSRDYEEAKEIIGKDLVPSQHFRCDSNGDYDAVQCIGEQCLCVDTSDGAPTYPGDALVNLTLISNETLKCYRGKKDGIYYNKCEAEYIEILNEVNGFLEEGYDMIFAYSFPKCDIDGTYSAVQENSTHKICVDKEGVALTAVDKVENTTIADAMDCRCIRAHSVISSREAPTCDLNGNYSPIQCRRGVCRCVDNDGIQVCTSVPCEVDENDKDTLTCLQ